MAEKFSTIHKMDTKEPITVALELIFEYSTQENVSERWDDYEKKNILFPSFRFKCIIASRNVEIIVNLPLDLCGKTPVEKILEKATENLKNNRSWLMTELEMTSEQVESLRQKQIRMHKSKKRLKTVKYHCMFDYRIITGADTIKQWMNESAETLRYDHITPLCDEIEHEDFIVGFPKIWQTGDLVTLKGVYTFAAAVMQAV